MLAGKLFRITSELDLNTIAGKLSGTRVESQDQETGLNLVTEFKVDALAESELDGTIFWDRVIYLSTREGKKPTVSTLRIPFVIRLMEGQKLLFIAAKRPIANNMANEISKAAFIRPGYVVEARIDPKIFLEYYEKNLEDTRVAYFDQVDIPNVNVLALYGDSLSQTDIFKEYREHGLLWYIVVKAKSIGQIIGITRNCVVTMFSKGTLDELISFAFNEVAPLVLRSLKSERPAP